MEDRCYSIWSESEGRHGCLRNALPEVGVVAEKQRGACIFQRHQAIERSQHLLTIVDEARQPSFSQRAAEITGVARQDDFTLVGPQLERLMPRRVAVGR